MKTKKVGTKKTEGKKTAAVGQKSPETAKRREFMAELIGKGKFNRKQIIEKTIVKFSEVKESTLATELTDGKNQKYTGGCNS